MVFVLLMKIQLLNIGTRVEVSSDSRINIIAIAENKK